MKNFYPLRTLLVIASLIGSVFVASAVSYITRNNVRYRYNEAKTEVYVTQLKDNMVYVGDVEIPATIENSEGKTIPVVGVYASAFSDCTNLNSVTLAESVTAIGDYAFDGCTAITKVVMPGVKTIGHWSFRNCYELGNVHFSNQLKSIGNYCFDKNMKMEIVDLPSTVTNIGGYAFEGNPQITTVICHAINPPAVKKGYLDGEEIYTLFEDNDYGNIKLYVPEESIQLYKQTLGWLQFGDNIFPITTLGVEASTASEVELSVKPLGQGRIEIANDTQTTVTIVNLQGQLIKALTLQPGFSVISNLPSGILFINGKKVMVK